MELDGLAELPGGLAAATRLFMARSVSGWSRPSKALCFVKASSSLDVLRDRDFRKLIAELGPPKAT
jgi:hypothetical protein